MSFNIPYPAGDKFRRDHIQWPTILRSQIGDVRPGMSTDAKDALWPVDISLAQVMALCWRVRKWDFSGNIDVSVTTTFPNSPDPDIVNSASGTATVDATEIVNLLNGVEAVSERDIIGKVFNDETNERTSAYKNLINDGLSFVPGNAPVSDWTTKGDFGDFSGSLSTIFEALGGYYLFDEVAGKFGPPFRGPSDLIPVSNVILATARFFRNPATVLSGATPLLLKSPIAMTVIPGIAPSFDVPMELAWRFAGEIPGGTTNGSGSGSFTLQATEFWPYSNSLGEPIYDEGTGDPTGADPLA